MTGTPRTRRVAWINQGVAGTEPWTTAHHAAHLRVRDRFGPDVVARFVESVAPGGHAGAAIDRLVADGHGLIFATSLPFEPDLVAAARRHPTVHFEQARGRAAAPNLSSFAGADEEPVLIGGMALAEVTGAGEVGFVGTVREPETVRHVNAFALGLRRVSPAMTVRVVWAGSWWNPTAEADCARGLIADGVVGLATGCTSPAVGEVATAARIPWSGHGADPGGVGRTGFVTAAVPDWGPYYERRVASHLDGTWGAADYYGAMVDGYTDIAPLGDAVPDPARRRLLALRRALLAGRLDVFAGPLHDRSGRLRVPGGATLPIGARLTLDWYVEGIEEEGPLRPRS